MRSKNRPILYIKKGCPWCIDALNYFNENGLDLDIREVRSNQPFMDQLVRISGQKKTPTFVYGEFVVADFDIGEFKAALKNAPSIKSKLGLA